MQPPTPGAPRFAARHKQRTSRLPPARLTVSENCCQVSVCQCGARPCVRLEACSALEGQFLAQLILYCKHVNLPTSPVHAAGLRKKPTPFPEGRHLYRPIHASCMSNSGGRVARSGFAAFSKNIINKLVSLTSIRINRLVKALSWIV